MQDRRRGLAFGLVPGHIGRMPTLAEKIESDAAARLTLAPNRRPSQELARYKRYLKVETHRLKMLHRAGASGEEICRARAVVLDALMRHLLGTLRRDYLAAASRQPPPVAIVAIGGYGRGELNPHSDIDIMFLHDGHLIARDKPHPFWDALNLDLLYTLYDIGLKVGHSVRSIEDCVRVANTDMQSKTSLIEARCAAGNEALFHEMQRVVIGKCVQGHAQEYIAQRLKDQEERRTQFGNSACMQEPNIKNGCGGLRDYQNLLWMAFFKYRIRSLAELQQRDQISEQEKEQLERAYNYLLRVRNDLHYLVNRPSDALSKNVQPAIAYNLGFTDRSPMKRIEKFMRQVYTHMRHIYLITRTVEQRLALLPQPTLLPAFRGLFRAHGQKATDGFKIAKGTIHAASTRVFRDQPRRLMRVFLLAQQRGAKLHPDLAQMIRHQLSLVNRAFLVDPHVRDTFLEILNQRGNVAAILRAMHEVGLLGRYLPEFGRLTCLVQHEFFHRYTADEHTLMCLEKLDLVWGAKEAPFVQFSDLFQKMEHPYILYLALLLHDTGKGNPASRAHTNLSTQLARRVSQRLNLNATAAQTLHLLVENHLAMIQISQRRDLDDPAVADNLAREMRTPENLALLLLHTFADTLGTGASLWNGFKELLLWRLYHCTLESLVGRSGLVQEESKLRDFLAREVRRLVARPMTEEELQAHFNLLPDRYYRIHSAPEIAAHLGLVRRFLQLQSADEPRGLEPVIAWHKEPDRGYATVTICTWDRSGLFSKLAGSLTAAHFNILSAQIFSRTDRIIIDTFYVTEAQHGTLPDREAREHFEELARQVLTGQLDLDVLLEREKKDRPLFPYVEGERLPTAIHFDNTISDSRTVIDVETEDRVGLLYTIARALSELKLDISTAKICTEKGAAFDSFYVREFDGRKVLDPERLNSIETELRTAVASLDRTAIAPAKG